MTTVERIQCQISEKCGAVQQDLRDKALEAGGPDLPAVEVTALVGSFWSPWTRGGLDQVDPEDYSTDVRAQAEELLEAFRGLEGRWENLQDLVKEAGEPARKTRDVALEALLGLERELLLRAEFVGDYDEAAMLLGEIPTADTAWQSSLDAIQS